MQNARMSKFTMNGLETSLTVTGPVFGAPHLKMAPRSGVPLKVAPHSRGHHSSSPTAAKVRTHLRWSCYHQSKMVATRDLWLHPQSDHASPYHQVAQDGLKCHRQKKCQPRHLWHRHAQSIH